MKPDNGNPFERDDVMSCKKLAMPLLFLGVALACGAVAEDGGTQEDVGNAIERGATATASGVERGVEAAARGTEKGVKAAASGIERGAKATVRGVERGANATADALERVSRKVGGE